MTKTWSLAISAKSSLLRSKYGMVAFSKRQNTMQMTMATTIWSDVPGNTTDMPAVSKSLRIVSTIS